MAEDDVYTKDGTVDVHKKPADKTKMGKWKACRFIIGNKSFERLVNYMIMKLGLGKWHTYKKVNSN